MFVTLITNLNNNKATIVEENFIATYKIMQTLRKKTSPCKYRNDPGRFFGDGVTFKAKLIGILEVGEARGDRMCQEALQDLKMAIRAAGEHKQRITIHVTIDGLRLRDEKTGDSLYHHPVHKISFIAQDMTDSRAFGYIFGSPDSGHRFFGIKTDKAASQVVLAMRDLFQVVFELKKKEIEMARQQIQSKTIHEHQPLSLTVKNASNEASNIANKSINDTKSNVKEMSPESVADLVDLEQELSSIQRGITQMERITPSEPTPNSKILVEEDPFGDSFTNFPTYNLLPPPESSRSRHSKPIKPPDTVTADASLPSLVSSQQTTSANMPSATSSLASSNWLDNSDDVVTQFETKKPPVDTSSTSQLPTEGIQPQKTGEELNQTQNFTNNVAPQPSTTQNQYIDAFTDLDPLGTGKSKPYVDKKYFFQELKNPPKKVLKDLSGQESSFPATFSINERNEIIDVFDKNTTTETFDITKSKAETKTTDFQQKNFSQTSSLFPTQAKPNANHNDKVFNIDIERTKLDEPVMMTRDTDPFSPTRKKSDPFQDGGDIFTKLDPFEFEFPNKSTVLPDTKITTDDSGKTKKETVFNGPLQVNLPPESWSTNIGGQKRIERQTSESPNSSSRTRPSVFKQNTVDVISSISSKKMPHLFGQKFSKRDSNSINMRRLQESDSLSENETAPEPPPRPESSSHIEPPPLPPKKQFSDIVIRPRITSSSAIPPPIRYDYVTAKMKSNQLLESAPPIPLPSRRVGRTDSSYPGPGRPGRKPCDEEDYLTPINTRSDVPPLLPPPQTTKGRGRRLDHVEHKAVTEKSVSKIELQSEPFIPDITLSQLLTLGIDELAAKLNVPTTKLSTMTLVELTQYLSEFIENSKRKPADIIEETHVFKVNFDDQHSDATFVAKFDDNFGEEPSTTFVANFPNFNENPDDDDDDDDDTQLNQHSIPPADRYAVLREIIEQDIMMHENGEGKTSASEDEEMFQSKEDFEEDRNEDNEDKFIGPVQIPKIDTKITEVISHAKDRYAALRDIILVEDLFEKPNPLPVDMLLDSEIVEEKLSGEEGDNSEEKESSLKDESSPESIQNFEDQTEEIRDTQIKTNCKPNGTFMHTLTVSTTDDIEIDELMNRAISNLSLDSRDHLSPNPTKSPLIIENASTSPTNLQRTSKSPVSAINQISGKSQFSDVSTSPIPLQKSPAQKSPLSKSPLSKSPTVKSPVPQSPAVTNLIASSMNNSGSLSDVICGSSPEADGITSEVAKMPLAPAAPTESWAIFEKATERDDVPNRTKSSKTQKKDVGESPCSSDGKDEWKAEHEYGRRWPKGHTSSSSRDLSPWDDETPDYKKRIPPGADRHGYYMRHARRMNSCDDDYEYEEGMPKRRERKLKSSMNRSRENFDPDSKTWYQPGNHHSWSPPDDEDRTRPFERTSYERSTYGPPFDKRDHKLPMHSSYDRRDHKNYDKRKYYREYTRPDYDFEPYGESPDTKDRKMIYYDDNFEKQKCRPDYDYEEVFGRDGRMYKSREYFYDRERKSFDRDSVESYESANRRHKSFGSGEVYGSLDSREEFRERYLNVEKNRSLRKGMKIRGNEDYEQDSENDVQMRRIPGDTKSLQRPPQSTRIRKSSGSSPWDGEEPQPPTAPGQKVWKRPSSASESERRLAERRVLCHTLSGSDGEKDRRFRKKPRSRGKDIDNRQQNIPIPRYPASHRDPSYDYMNYDDYEQPPPADEDKFERLNRRRHDMHQRMLEADRRRKGGDKYSYDEDDNEIGPKYLTRKERFFTDKDRYSNKFDAFDDPNKNVKPPGRCEFDFDDFEETPRSNTSSNKFNFEEHGGFESDFNSPPPPTAGSTTTTKSSYRFSNDFSEKEKPSANASSFDTDYSQTPTQKLRFDDKVTVSKFENDQPGAFEDDFSKAEFVFENEDQWNPEQMKKSNVRSIKRHENIRKSESVNIFARKSEDPFEDDDFFKTTSPSRNDAKKNGDEFQWDNNFAKFDENM